MKRNEFIKKTSMVSMILALHPEFLFSCKDISNSKTSEKTRINLLDNIKLLTSTSLGEMKGFYAEKLGLPIAKEHLNEITFIARKSTITFVKVDASFGNPWYHFAFNIPENKILAARKWQLERSEVIQTPKNKRDVGYPDEIRHFKHWNAHSLFFWDPAGNLLEYIARHDLDNRNNGEFTSDDILNVSEIAFVVDDQESEAKNIGKTFGLDVYPKSSSFWWAMGDENGLLLCIPKRLWGENTSAPKRFEVFNTEATLVNVKKTKYEFDKFPYKVLSV